MSKKQQQLPRHDQWNLHKHHSKPYRYTDGIYYLMQITNCDWLIDKIFSHQRKEEFQVWKLTVNRENKTGVLTMKEDTREPYLVKQKIPETDFPMDYIKLWMMGETLILTSEYE